MTHCSKDAMEFKTLGRRSVVADFSGGHITSDAGVLLLDKTDQVLGLLRRAAACFTDHRDADLIEHTVEHLIRRRVFALALGYEDLNDHDELSRDPLLAAVVGKREPTGAARRKPRDRNRPLAGTSLAHGRCDTIRLKLLKIGASVKVSVRRVRVSLAGGYPLQSLFRWVCRRLEAAMGRVRFCPLRC